MLATSLVEKWHCGAQAAGYLKEGNAILPSIPGDEVEATICFYVDSAYPCQVPTTIKIKKCRNFLIYNLPNTLNCGYGYCGQK